MNSRTVGPSQRTIKLRLGVADFQVGQSTGCGGWF
jgi:hypothetical protein